MNDSAANKLEKAVKAKNTASYLLCFVLSFLPVTAVFVCGYLSKAGTPTAAVGLGYSLLMLAFPVIFSAYNSSRLIKELRTRPLEETRQTFLNSREKAEKTKDEFEKKFRKIVLDNRLIGVWLALFALSTAFFGGAIGTNGIGIGIPFSILSVYTLTDVILRVSWKENPAEEAEDSIGCAPASEFPKIYSIANKAAEKLGYTGTVSICFTNSPNIGINERSAECRLYLGIDLISILSEEELFNVFLHELSHAVYSSRNGSLKPGGYVGLNGAPYGMTFIGKTAFSYNDNRLGFEYSVYTFALSVICEQEADRDMARLGDPHTAASALLKTFYTEMFLWENRGSDPDESELVFRYEQPEDSLRPRINALKSCIGARHEIWDGYVDREIISLSASHPTLRMRLDGLGIEKAVYTGTDFPSETEYTAELEKAADLVWSAVKDYGLPNYSELRENYYLKPLGIIEKWEKEGRPITKDTYYEIIDSLISIGRKSDTLSFADEVIGKFGEKDVSTDFARYIKGCILLYRLDPSGIPLIYSAVESNSNFKEEGMDMIGSFCRISGNAEELEKYRQKFVPMMQYLADVESKINILTAEDRLSEEKELPEVLRENILRHIISVSGHKLKRVYMFRKTVTDGFFSTVFVLVFMKNAAPDERGVICDKIFRYLDTCSDRQFSLFVSDGIPRSVMKKIRNYVFYEER